MSPQFVLVTLIFVSAGFVCLHCLIPSSQCVYLSRLFICWRVFLFPVICTDNKVYKYKYVRKTHMAYRCVHVKWLKKNEIGWRNKERAVNVCVFTMRQTFFSSCMWICLQNDSLCCQRTEVPVCEVLSWQRWTLTLPNRKRKTNLQLQQLVCMTWWHMNSFFSLEHLYCNYRPSR